jgi:hypothetical protein
MRVLKFVVALVITFSFIFNCSAQSGRSITKDFDGDGFLSFEHGGTDCNDLNFRVNPAANPRMNGSDCNCNGIADYQETIFEFTDVNQSGSINILDLCTVLEDFGSEGESNSDVNKDFVVNLEDIQKIITKYLSLTYGF